MKPSESFLQTQTWAKNRQDHRVIKLDQTRYVVIKIIKLKFLNIIYGVIQRSAELSDQDLQIVREQLPGLSWLQIEVNKLTQKSTLRTWPKPSVLAETVVLDLNHDEDQLLMRTSSTHRQNIRKSAKKGLELNCGNSQELFEQFLDVMSEIKTSTRFIQPSQEHYQKTYQSFVKDGHGYITIAKLNGKVLGAYLCVEHRGTVSQLYGGANANGRQQRIMQALVFASILEAKRRGNDIYDFWGAAPYSPEHGFSEKSDKYGISMFKLAFGGTAWVYEPPKVIVYSKLKYSLGKIYLRLVELKLKVRKMR